MRKVNLRKVNQRVYPPVWAASVRVLIMPVGDLSARQRFGQRVLLHNAHPLLHHLSIFKEHDGGNTLNAVLHRDALVLIHIHLANFGFARSGLGDSLDGWSEHAAWHAPLSPEIDKHRNGALQDFGFEICFGKFKSACTGHRWPRVSCVS